MSTIMTHAAIPVALSPWFPREAVPPAVLVLGALCAMAPDLDVLGFAFGIRYGAPFGHRGFTHSALFAAGLAALLVPFLPVPPAQRPAAFCFLFLSTLSHPLLDAFTDGGLGVALLWPFEERRYFFPWRPLAVPHVGVRAFFTARAWPVLESELLWVWAPGALIYALGRLLRTLLR